MLKTHQPSTWHRRLSYLAIAWAALFGAPHLWWALGIPAGFPGGPASHEFMMSSAWRHLFDVIVVLLSVMMIIIVLTLLRPSIREARRKVSYAAAWIGSGMLTLRGVAGLLVDGSSDPVWWPTFLIGGILLGSIAWLARPRRFGQASQPE